MTRRLHIFTIATIISFAATLPLTAGWVRSNVGGPLKWPSDAPRANGVTQVQLVLNDGAIARVATTWHVGVNDDWADTRVIWRLKLAPFALLSGVLPLLWIIRRLQGTSRRIGFSVKFSSSIFETDSAKRR